MKQEEVALKSDNQKLAEVKLSPLVKFFIVLTVFCFALLGIVLNYFNTSIYNYDPEVESFSFSEKEKIAKEAIKTSSFSFSLSKTQLNKWLKEHDHKETIQLIFGEYAENLRYDEDKEFFVVDFHGPFINTSLFFKIELNKSAEKESLKMVDLELGKNFIPITYECISPILKLPKEEMVLSRDIFMIEQLKIGNRFKISGTINEEYYFDLAKSINNYKSGQYISYLTGVKGVKIPAVYGLIKDNFAINEISRDFLLNSHDIYNWLLILNEEDRLAFADNYKNSMFLCQQVSDIDLALEYDDKIKNLESDYQKFLEEDATSSIESTLRSAYKKIAELHQEKGVPLQLVDNFGRVYSQTLEMYIDNNNLGLESQFSSNLYAKNDQIAIGYEDKDDFKYLTINLAGEVSDLKSAATKEEFLKSINYNNWPEPAAEALMVDDPNRKLIIKSIMKNKEWQLMPFIRNIRSDGKFAYVALSSNENMQSIEQFILKKNSSDWQVILELDADQKITACSAQLKTEKVNKRILPPFRVEDFVVHNYTLDDIEAVVGHLIASNSISPDSKTKFFSRIGDNLYLVTTTGERVLIVFQENSKTLYQDLYKIAPDQKLEDYKKFLDTNSEYRNYYPDFVFLQ